MILLLSHMKHFSGPGPRGGVLLLEDTKQALIEVGAACQACHTSQHVLKLMTAAGPACQDLVLPCGGKF